MPLATKGMPVGMDTLLLLSKTNREPAPGHAWLGKQANPAEQYPYVLVQQTGTYNSYGTNVAPIMALLLEVESFKKREDESRIVNLITESVLVTL